MHRGDLTKVQYSAGVWVNCEATAGDMTKYAGRKRNAHGPEKNEYLQIGSKGDTATTENDGGSIDATASTKLTDKA